MKLTEVNGFVWPAEDTECRRIVFSTTSDMDLALAMVPHRRIAVQAGGNCGVWAAHLAKTFDRVFTFEPDPVNYHCLAQNVPTNVRHFEAALGDGDGRTGLKRIAGNCGAHALDGEGDIPVMAIDSLNLEACDYLCLDIEGYELIALRGAARTIRRFRPVIQIEDKGLSRAYGHEKGDAERWLAAEFGYQVAHRINRDVILK